MESLTIGSWISPALACVISPFLFGIINRTKALFAGRRGQSLFQLYYDLFKLMKKGVVYSRTTTWLVVAGPIVSVASFFLVSFLVPFGKLNSPFSFTGDIFLVVYLMAIARFFMVLAALDTGSAFEGMGASREVFFSLLIEPVLLLCLLGLARQSHGLSFTTILVEEQTHTIISRVLLSISLFIILLAENCRIPFDDPNTHLELTMIHEVMVLDHSGPDLAFVHYAASLKLWFFSLLTTRVLIPFHATTVLLDVGLTCIVLCTLVFCVGVLESTIARLRLLRIPQLIIVAFSLATLSLLFGTKGLL